MTVDVSFLIGSYQQPANQTIYYTFDESLVFTPSINNPDDPNEILDLTQNVNLDSTQEAATTYAMNLWEDVAGISFSDNGTPVLTISEYNFPNPMDVGFFSAPTPSGGIIGNGDIFIDADETDFQVGGSGFVTVLHELGHSLGLIGDNIDPLDLPYGVRADQETTIMSYGVSLNNAIAITPMIYDIAAIQDIYDANTSYNSGNTFYTLDGINSADDGSVNANTVNISEVEDGYDYIAQTIWDGGGDDTIDASLYTGNSIIDLREGEDFVTTVGSTKVWNAFGSNIENALSGDGNDIIFGNISDNLIDSGAGNDIIKSGGGSDIVDGGSGDEHFVYVLSEKQSGDADEFRGNLGRDTLELHLTSGEFISAGVEADILSFYSFIQSNNDETITVGNEYVFSTLGLTASAVENVQLYIDGVRQDLGINAETDLFSVAYGQNLTGNVLADNGFGADNSFSNTLSVVAETLVTRQGQSVTISANGSFNYTSASDFSGSDLFEYTLIDDYGNLDTAVVSIFTQEEPAPGLSGSGSGEEIDDDELGNYIEGTEDSDTINGNGGNDEIYGFEGNDHISGGDGNDIIFGGEGNGYLQGDDGIDTIHGGVHYDIISGGEGNDILYGHAHVDDIQGDQGSDTIYGGTGRDNLYGGDDGDTIYGGHGHDNIHGGEGNDTLVGSFGDEELHGNQGNDSIDGGEGFDIAYYSDATTGINIDLSQSATISVSDGRGGTDTLTSIEGIVGTDFNDTITLKETGGFVSAGLGSDTIFGGGGNDEISVAGTSSDSNAVSSGTGDDVISLYGYADNNVNAGDGNDSIHINRASGTNEIDAENGDDYVYMTSINPSGSNYIFIDGGHGVDTLFFDFDFELNTSFDLEAMAAPIDLLNGNTVTLQGFENMEGYLFQGNVRGDNFDNTLDFSSGEENTLDGAGGNDIVIGGYAADVIIHDYGLNKAATDNYNGGTGNDVLRVEIDLPDLTQEIKDELLDFQQVHASTVNSNTDDNSVYRFTKFGLTAQNIEALEVYVDGVLTSTGPQAADDDFAIEVDDTLNANLLADNGNGLDDGFDVNLSTVAETISSLQGGSVIINSDGTFSYMAPTGYVGTDSFTYTVQDSYGQTSIGTATITIAAGVNEITGTSSAEIITGTSDSDLIFALEGNDQVDGGAGDDVIYGGEGNDIIVGGDGNDIAYGEAGNDDFFGSLGDDVLYGGDGIDRFAGVAVGDDSFDGGDDTSYDQVFYNYTEFSSGVDIDLSSNTVDKRNGYTDTLIDIETVYGSPVADVINGDDGNNQLYGWTGDDVIYAGNGQDYLNGGSGNDTLYGGDGHDTFYNATGNNIIYGGNGEDSITAGNGNDILNGGAGLDNFNAHALGDDIYNGDDQYNFLRYDYSTSFSNGITVDGVNKTVDKGSGNVDQFDNISSIHGTNYADNYEAGSNAITFYGEGGNDIISGGSAMNEFFYGGEGNDTINGGAGVDRLEGNEGNDILNGGDSSHDLIYAGAGDDLINGGAGGDVLYGNDGADTFVFDDLTLADRDDIGDFDATEGDIVDLSELLSGYDPLNDLIDDFVSITEVSGDSIISVDQDGTGTTYGFQDVVTLHNVTSLVLDDLIDDGNMVV